jgi:CBS domain containing-hemolysin-like protein
MIELVLFILAFICTSGFLAMIDAAILSVSPAEVEVMIERKRWGAKELKHLLRYTTRAIIVIVILTNVTNILGPILAGRKAEQLFGSEAIGVITAILTFTTIIFSEIIPKAVGSHYAPTISRFIAPVLGVLVLILYPLVLLLEKLVRLFKTGKRKVGTEEQIRALANLGRGAGHIDADERELIHRAFVLNDRSTKDIMMPASKIIAIPMTATIREAAKVVFEHTYSRYPVIGKSINDSQGYVLSRDILEALADGEGSYLITTVLRKIIKAPAIMRCDELLNVLRKSMAQIALVSNGSEIIGLVTLEDVLEELVGEINDEGDREE